MSRKMSNRHPMLLPVVIFALGLSYSAALAAATPHYKPSSRSPQALDITTNSYGFSRTAPAALALGDRAPDFTLPRSGGGSTSLTDAREDGPVVLIFYRGHW